MDNNVDLAVAIDAINGKIANLNIKIVENKTDELQKELDKYLNIREKIYQGNADIIKKVIDGEI